MPKPHKLYRVKVSSSIDGYIDCTSTSKKEAMRKVSRIVNGLGIHKAIDMIREKSVYHQTPISWVSIISKVAKQKTLQ